MIISAPMPDVLNALVAFVAEHQRCGELDGGRNGRYIWLGCSCGETRRLGRLGSYRSSSFTLVLCRTLK